MYTHINTLFVIMKIAERCNLACSYCYYYSDENAEVFNRPPLMRRPVLERVVSFIEHGATQLPIDHVVFAFHGGEPTLAKAEPIREFCRMARERVSARGPAVSFAIQTNGVFLSEAWRQLMIDERINVGVSIDGDKDTHDAFRFDHRGRGSYDRIRATVSNLHQSKIKVSALSVMGSAFEGLQSYLHLVRELGISQLKLLLPDYTRDSIPMSDDELVELGHSLCQVFDHWLVHDQASVRVALFDDTVRRHIQLSKNPLAEGTSLSLGLSVLSDGAVRLSDDFMTPSEWFGGQMNLNIFDSTLDEWLTQPHMRELSQARSAMPVNCQVCPHLKVCSGGDLPNRYSKSNGFDNPSAYCTTLKIFHKHVALRLHEGFDEVERISA